MCGIAGSVSARPRAADAVAAMTAAQRHRGPDGVGQWRDAHCALGHRRLAIIDLSDLGCQPMCDSTGGLRLVYNGEIYNFQALRRELEGRGHRFRSGTDSEVVLYAYREWGTQCVSRFRGMFAFALWDSERRILFLARDRAGKKPLFWTQVGDRVLFSSEVQGVLADEEVPRDVDWTAIDSYLSFGYVPAPSSGFAALRKLPPAHWMTVDVSSDPPTIRTECYWQLQYKPKQRTTGRHAAAELRDLVTEAVRLRMISDVPLGAFLSGGIDSSIVVGLMAQLADHPVRTFSIGFDEAGWSELPHARRIAELWGTDHHEEIVRPDALAVLPTLVQHYGEPYADSSAIPTYYVSQIARRHVTVALNGDGGDESFAGYERYRGNQIAAAIAGVPGSRLATHALSRALPDSIDPKSRLRRARRFLDVAHDPMPVRYARWAGYFAAADKARLYRPEMRELLAGHDATHWMHELFAATTGLNAVDAAMSVDVRSYLPYDLLVKVDITSMAHSLEARSPFLDDEVMEFAATLPAHLKVRPGAPKYLLRKAFADLLPAENVQRRKMGFGVPVGEWFRGPLRGLLDDTLLAADSRVGEYLDRSRVRALADAHLERRAESTMQLWALLMLEMWHRGVVERPRPDFAATPTSPVR
jgi:asparagine synthase (glutamine-hydrolysing)